MWDPPFSLDLTDAEPDIVYCLEVYDIFCGKKSNIINDCNVTQPHYTFQFLTSGYTREVVITPRSNVERAMNGSQLVVEGTNNYYPVLNKLNLQCLLSFPEPYVFLKGGNTSRNRYEIIDPFGVRVDIEVQFTITVSILVTATYIPSLYIVSMHLQPPRRKQSLYK